MSDRLTWTINQPPVPGWYWWRGIVFGSTFTKIYEVEMLGTTLGIRGINQLEYIDGEWAGPLEPPKETYGTGGRHEKA